METVLTLGVTLFVVTHLDTVVVISAFCADNDYRAREVLVGHYLGFAIGLSAAVLGAILASELLREWTFLLGIVPLCVGLWGLVRRPPEASVESSRVVPNSAGRIGVVAITGIGLSGENIAVYVPFFADLSTTELTVVVGLYLVGAGLVFLAARLLVSRVAVDGIPDRVDRWLVPSVLVLVGGYVVVTGFAVT